MIGGGRESACSLSLVGDREAIPQSSWLRDDSLSVVYVSGEALLLSLIVCSGEDRALIYSDSYSIGDLDDELLLLDITDDPKESS